MATITKNVLSEGPTKIIYQVIIEGDNQGDVTDYLLVDPVEFMPSNMQSPNLSLSIMQMWASSAWFDVAFKFNGVAKTVSWLHSRDAGNYYDFRYFGGLKDQSNEDPDGKVLITTSGVEVGSLGTFIIEFRKN
jgi:hypothetical protein